MAGGIRVVVVDHEGLVREGTAKLLHSEPGFDVVGRLASAVRLHRAVRTTHPDVICLDARLPQVAGTVACEIVRERLPRLGVVLFPAAPRGDGLRAAVEARPHALMLKSSSPAVLFAAVRAASSGRSFVDPVLQHLDDVSAASSRSELKFGLTPHELRVLRLLPGQTNRQIAAQLGTSLETVKSQVTSVFRKLGANDRAHAVAIAIGEGVVAPAFAHSVATRNTRPPEMLRERRQVSSGEVA